MSRQAGSKADRARAGCYEHAAHMHDAFIYSAPEASLGGSGKGADERTQKAKLLLWSAPFFVEASDQRSKLDALAAAP
jgi:hypothetical protein